MLRRESFPIFLWFLVAMTFVGAVGIPKGFNYSISVVFILALAFLACRSKIYQCTLTADDKMLILSFLGFAFSLIFINSFHEFRLRDLDHPSRFIFAIPVLLLMIRMNDRREFIWYGIAIGAILAFGLGLYQRVALDIERVYGDEVAIMFGDTSMMLGLLSLVGALYFIANRNTIWVVISIVGALCGFGASILSGARGGWVAFPFITIFLIYNCYTLFRRSSLLKIVLVLVVGLIMVVVFPQTNVQVRIDQALNNITHYEDGSNKNTSVGLRFDMWKAAWYMFEEHPILGAGLPGSISAKRAYVKEGLVGPGVLDFNHAHNEYLTSLGLRGAVGLLFLMGVYLVPLRLFLKKMRQYEHNWNVKAYAMAGAIVPMSYMDFALTQAMFNHNIGVMMYAFPIVFFWAAVRWAEREESGRV